MPNVPSHRGNQSETARQQQSWECYRDFILKFISMATDHAFLIQSYPRFVKVQVQFEQQVAAI